MELEIPEPLASGRAEQPWWGVGRLPSPAALLSDSSPLASEGSSSCDVVGEQYTGCCRDILECERRWKGGGQLAAWGELRADPEMKPSGLP